MLDQRQIFILICITWQRCNPQLLQSSFIGLTCYIWFCEGIRSGSILLNPNLFEWFIKPTFFFMFTSIFLFWYILVSRLHLPRLCPRTHQKVTQPSTSARPREISGAKAYMDYLLTLTPDISASREHACASQSVTLALWASSYFLCTGLFTLSWHCVFLGLCIISNNRVIEKEEKSSPSWPAS